MSPPVAATETRIVTERHRIRGDIDIPVESEVLASKGEYLLVERHDHRVIKYGVLRSFGDSSHVVVGEFTGMPLAAARYDELIGKGRS